MKIMNPILKYQDAGVSPISPQDIIHSQGSDSGNYSPELTSPGTAKGDNDNLNLNFRLIPWSMQQALDDPK